MNHQLEHQIREVLTRLADDTNVTAGAEFGDVSLATALPTRSRRALAGAGALALAGVLGVGIVVTRSATVPEEAAGSPPTNSRYPIAVAPGGRISRGVIRKFPVIDETDDRIVRISAGGRTSAAYTYNRWPGRGRGESWQLVAATDRNAAPTGPLILVTMSAAADAEVPSNNLRPGRMEGVLEEQVVPGFWYLVATVDAATFVLQGSDLDRMYQLLSVLKPVTVGSQLTDWQVVGPLQGMVLSSAVHMTPELGAFPSLSLLNGRIQIEMRPESSLALIAGWPGVGEPTLGAPREEVEGVLGHGYVVDNGLGFVVAAFGQADGTTLYATGSDIPRDEFLAALAAVTFVDEATWLQRYHPDPTDVRPDGRVVEAASSVTEAAIADTAPSTNG